MGEDSKDNLDGETEIMEEDDYYDYYEGDGAEEEDAVEAGEEGTDEARSTGSATATSTGATVAKAEEIPKEPSAEEIIAKKKAEEEKKEK
jgi:hypothetical protein